MNTNINLLLRTDEQTLRRQKRVKTLNFIAIMFLAGVGAISLLLFLLIQIVNPSGIKKEQNDIMEKISQFQDVGAKLFVANNRIGNIEKVLEKRIDLSQVTSGLLAKIPGQLSIDDLEVDDKSVIITGQSKSLWAIGEFINNLTDMVRKKEIIKSLNLNSLMLDESRNVYQVSIKSEL